jgi:hypothetical protein
MLFIVGRALLPQGSGNSFFKSLVQRTHLHKRVGQGENDQVVFPSRLSHEGASVVDMDVYAQIEIGAGGIVLAAEVRDDGVDFDRIDVGDAITQGGRHIIAGTGTHHQNVQPRLLF